MVHPLKKNNTVILKKQLVTRYSMAIFCFSYTFAARSYQSKTFFATFNGPDQGYITGVSMQVCRCLRGRVVKCLPTCVVCERACVCVCVLRCRLGISIISLLLSLPVQTSRTERGAVFQCSRQTEREKDPCGSQIKFLSCQGRNRIQ